MTISASEATFEGFRVTRAHPRAVVVWAAVWLIAMIVMMLASLPLILPYAEELQTAQGNPSAMSAGAQAAVQRAGLVFLAIAPLFQALLMPAVFRAVMRPEAKAFGFLRVGPIEGRILIVGLVLTSISLILNLGGTALETMVRGVGGVAAAAGLNLVLLLVSVWISVRMALIPAMTFRAGRLAFGPGWRAGGRHFWSLLGVSVMSLALAAVVAVLLILIGSPLFIVTLAAGNAPTTAAAVASIVILLLIPLGFALVSTLVWAPFAAIARDLTPEVDLTKR